MYPGRMTTPHQPDVYNTNSKQILVARDPVFTHSAYQSGVTVSRQPYTYMLIAIVVTVFNPFLGPIAMFFAYMSNKAFNQGDMKFAEKYSQYAFLMCMITIVATVFIYIIIFFSLSTIGYRGGLSY